MPKAAPSSVRPANRKALQTSTTAATSDKAGTDPTADFRFKRSNRLTDAASYGQVFRNARRSKDPLFTVLYRQNGDRAARLGLAISKKNCRSSVARNRLKRLVRESFRLHKQQLHGMDIVVLNQTATHKADNGALLASLAHHWGRCTAPTRGAATGSNPDRG